MRIMLQGRVGSTTRRRGSTWKPAWPSLRLTICGAMVRPVCAQEASLPTYPPSAQLAELGAEHILVNAVCPGYVATDLNNFAGVRTPAQGAVAAVRMATIPADGATGTFTDNQGAVAC